MNKPVLQIRNLSKHYPSSGGMPLVAVNDVTLSINPGEVLGVVGESGCGKSTLGRTVLRLAEPTYGEILYAGRDITTLNRHELKSMRKDAQIVFQDPFGALNPQHSVGQIIEEPLLVHKLGSRQQRVARVTELLELVGLPTNSDKNYPHEFSGGQRQRIAIARALASNPSFLVCDEAVSALDVSVQSQILNLLMELRQRLNLAMMFISHDLSVIRHISDRVAVMYLGKIVENAPTEQIMSNPQHPYTQALLSAIPNPLAERKARIILQGELPDPADPPTGCIFHTRCHKRQLEIDSQCINTVPKLLEVSTGCSVACHLHFQAVNHAGTIE
ncbi:ATP-binding cassette domain-containing protein [Granulosicoccus sp.]|nr:oligopeptide/dipeptide ABC transporter ATP-binding protein [Granulosicoccus sp.]MDB4223988.1 ATP-binding cassette domain-containing protein [Granulosicoccus sp.]